MLRQAVGLVCAGVVGLLLAVEALGDRPPDKPPCKGHAPCASTVTTTVEQTTASTVTVAGAPAPSPSGSAPPALADISVTVTAPAGIVFASEDVPYTVVVANAGPAVATGVHLGVVPAGSRLLASAAGSLGTLAPGASATTTVMLRPDAAGGMSAVFTAGADQLDPAPANNVAFVATSVVAGRPGPPGLQVAGRGAFRPPLLAVRSGGDWVVETKVHVDEPATVVVAVVDGSGRKQTMLPGTLVGYLPANRPHLSIPHVLQAASWLPLRIAIGGPAGRGYRVVVRATGPDGSVASTAIGFMTP